MKARKYAKITMPQGLINSFEVLKRLKKRTEIKDYEIYLGTFTNCRELGLTFYPAWLKDELLNKTKTFCIYEHRNSDEIIINGKDGYINHNGDLPYCGDSKWKYLGIASYEDYDKATDILVKEILKIKK